MTSWEEAGNYVLAKLRNAGYEAYIAGGAVRDKVLGVPVRDIDICTDASAESIKRIFPRTAEVGVSHGTVLVIVKDRQVEVSEFRTTDSTARSSLEEDLSLRDFTCNSMALNEDGSIFDPFHGREDIRLKRIRAAGDPESRFAEDPLRLLRGLRLSVQLGFQIEHKTMAAMTEMAPLIKCCAVERIAAELEKAAKRKLLLSELSFLLSHPVVKQFPYKIPGAASLEKMLESKREMDFYILDSVELWSFLCSHAEPEKARTFMKLYKRPNKVVKEVTAVLSEMKTIYEYGWNELALYRLGRHLLPPAEKLLALYEARIPEVSKVLAQFEALPLHSKKELNIDGKIVLREFPDPTGEWVGQALKAAETAVVLGKTENKTEQILKWLKRENWK